VSVDGDPSLTPAAGAAIVSNKEANMSNIQIVFTSLVRIASETLTRA